jgi:hypothetical protein
MAMMRARVNGPGRYLTCLVAISAALAAHPASAQQEPAVNSGVQYLKTHHVHQPGGESAMIALALLKAEVPPSDPALAACIARFERCFTDDGFNPERRDGTGVYEAAAGAMALSNLDAAGSNRYLGMIANYLMGRQNANGSWDYHARSAGDTSISQYAVLGLWEAENAGIRINPAAWDRAAAWFLSTQHASGGWSYHIDEQVYQETLSMTAAGVGSLLICQRQLERYRQLRRSTNPLLIPLTEDAPLLDYKAVNTPAQIEPAIQRGLRWLAANFTTSAERTVGPSPYYMLYGIERIGALADRQTLGRIDWYERGREFLRASQQGSGAWNGAHGAEMSTVWALLFLTKSTAKTLERIQIKRLGAGTLLGGRGLPKDLTSMTVAGGRVVSRPMNGAIEGMLAVLEDPRAEQGEAAVSGLVERYYREGPAVLRPSKDRFRKMLSDRDPGVRRVAAWALAHTEDMDVVPLLINALLDPDEEVVISARQGLQLLSRKISGMGPTSPSTPADRKAAAQRWREWFSAVRPLDLDEHDGPSDAPRAGSGPTSAALPAGGRAQ